jgi:small subunit ribosomal protein S6
MPATVRQYELVYIVRPDYSDEQVQGVITKYNGIVTTQGGTLERTDVWERRRLAYEIKGQNEGVYIVTVFRALPNVEAELRRVFRISEDTLRSIIVKPDEEIDTSVPSVQPRDFASRPQYAPPQQHAHAPVQATAPVAVAVSEPETAEATEVGDEAPAETAIEEAEPEAIVEAAAEPVEAEATA